MLSNTSNWRLIQGPSGKTLPEADGGSNRIKQLDREVLQQWVVRDGLCSCHYELRSEEHTSELQSHSDLVCRLLLEKKKKKTNSLYKDSKRSVGDYMQKT